MCFKTPLCAGSSSFWLHKLIAHHSSRRTIPAHGGPEGTPGLCSSLSFTSRHLPWFRCWSPLCLSVRSSHKSIIRCYLAPNGHEMVTNMDASSAKLKPIDFSLKGLVSPFPITWSLPTWFKTREVIHCGGCSVLSWGSKREPTRFQSLGVFPPCPVWFSLPTPHHAKRWFPYPLAANGGRHPSKLFPSCFGKSSITRVRANDMWWHEPLFFSPL